ncbi:MAG TPA: Ni/Fe hydrogenase subunit alpha [Planctomycetaceae bacterium]|nr:Ni/Fe hydrogenase subunit alpha [Planctomycetaceae bacterium]
MSETRSIKVEALTRVEGEGGLHIRLNGDVIEDVQLSIYEPPRFFEGFLRGRPLEEVPDITARICGICPVAYQMSAVHALEQALGVVITPEIRRLRRLLYCGEWIESHGLHMHLLQAPDFFNVASGIELAGRFPKEVNRGLKLKKQGNELLEALGGRAIHPINVAVGGFYRAPKREELQKLIPAFEWGLQAAIETTRWVAGFDFPDFKRPYEMVALSHSYEYAMNEGRIVSTSGLSIDVADYEAIFAEHHVAHSTALHSLKTVDKTSYHVGPLARVNLNRERLCETAQRVADEIRFETPCMNPFKAIIARGLEVIHAFDEALSILRDYRPFKPCRIEYEYRHGEGCAATEAPRGLIYHRYKVDDAGKVVFAKIVPPTSQNQRQIELDLIDWLPRVLGGDDQQTADDCERLIRSYDPCISCSTHFLKLTIDRARGTENSADENRGAL